MLLDPGFRMAVLSVVDALRRVVGLTFRSEIGQGARAILKPIGKPAWDRQYQGLELVNLQIRDESRISGVLQQGLASSNSACR